MKKIIFFCLALAILLLVPATAQDNNLVVRFKTGDINSWKISVIKSMTFNSNVMNINKMDGSNAVFAHTDVQRMYFEKTTVNSTLTTGNGNLQVYPKPSKGTIYFKGLTDEMVVMRIYNMSGVQLFTARVNAYVQSMDISFLPAGVYFINLDNQRVKLIKL